jgi:hypothetical protein
MRENITVYTITGSVEPRPTGSVEIDPSSIGTDPLLTPYSSSQHEVTRLNGLFIGDAINDTHADGDAIWKSMAGRGTELSTSQYGGPGQLMIHPHSTRPEYYAKTYTTSTDDPRFVKYIYSVDYTLSGVIPGASGTYITPASGASESTFDLNLGRLIDANSHDPFVVNIPVSKRGKIRDVKVWVEAVHRNRSGDTNSGLQGLQISLVSPNVKFPGAYPLWNMPGASDFQYDGNPNITGTDNLVNGTFSRRVPSIFTSGAYVLWDGHKASPALKYAADNLGLQNDYHEFDSDIDMRTIFTDSSQNDNPRSRIRVFPSASDVHPGAATNLSATLIYGLKPLSYYWSPSNFAQRYYSGTFSWSGISASLSGAVVPWFVDPRLSPGLMNQTVVGVPPDGWVTGNPNGLFQPWALHSGTGLVLFALATGSTSSTIAAGTTKLVYHQDQANHSPDIAVAVSGFVRPGDTIIIQDSLTASLSHSAVVTTNRFRLIGAPSSSSLFNINWNVSGSGNLSYAPADNKVTYDYGYGWGQVYFSPALPAGFHGQSKIHTALGVSYSLGTTYFNSASFYMGYDLIYSSGTGRYERIQDSFQLIYPIASGSPGGATPTIGSYISAFGRILRIQNIYSTTPIQGFFGPEGPGNYYYEGPYYTITVFEEMQYPGIVSDRDHNLFFSGTIIREAIPSSPSTTPETALIDLSLGKRDSFGSAFKPPNSIFLVGGAVNGGFNVPQVHILYFSGTKIIDVANSGAMTASVGSYRHNPGFFIVNPAPHSATFYIMVNGDNNATLTAITQSTLELYSTATVVSVTHSAPYSYKYWTSAEYYE